MIRSFRGETFHKVDGKGRVSIPASFRRVLEQNDPEWPGNAQPGFQLIYGDPARRFLECHTVSGMLELDQMIEEIPDRVARESATRRFITQSLAMEVDPSGRIVLSQMQRERIGLKEDAVFSGHNRTFRIWTPEAYAAFCGELDAGVVPDDPRTDPDAALDEVRRRRRS